MNKTSGGNWKVNGTIDCRIFISVADILVDQEMRAFVKVRMYRFLTNDRRRAVTGNP